jgi:hypothetical protein
MIHFVREMQAYCQLEVIECAWQELLEFVHKKDGDLDSLIRAHRSYLDRMRKKVLLLNTKVGREVRSCDSRIVVALFANCMGNAGELTESSEKRVCHYITIQGCNGKQDAISSET